MVDAYRSEFRADLMDLGVDLAVWWRDRRWLALYELFTHLPGTSRTKLAISQNPEAARIIAEHAPAPGPAEIPLRDVDSQMAVLLKIHDRLGELAQCVLDTIQLPPGKPRPRYKGQPIAIEQSAVEIARMQYQREIALHWTAQFFPHSTGFA
jgi:hypothetical protein